MLALVQAGGLLGEVRAESEAPKAQAGTVVVPSASTGASTTASGGTKLVSGAAAIPTTAAVTAVAKAPATSPRETFAPILPRLKRRGIKSDFLDAMLTDPSTHFEEKALALVILQFSQKGPSYSYATAPDAIEKSGAFLGTNATTLAACEKRTGVDREILTALMWVETRLGEKTGTYSVASVFLTLAMASQPEIIARQKEKLKTSFQGTKRELKQALSKVDRRAKHYSEWGVQELLALQKIHRKYGARFATPVYRLQGSWAGAFGMAQFIPSSYYRLAQDGDLDDKFDPYSVADSACSVGHFLKKAGWGKAVARRKRALLRYNHSTDYGLAILSLSKLIRSQRTLVTGDVTTGVPHAALGREPNSVASSEAVKPSAVK